MKTDQLEPAGRVIDKEKPEASSATWQAGGLVLDGLFGGRKSRSSIVTSATCAFKQPSDVGIAEDKVKQIELEAELAGEVGELEVNSTRLDTQAIKPYKKDIDVKSVSLVWLLYDRNNKPVW